MPRHILDLLPDSDTAAHVLQQNKWLVMLLIQLFVLVAQSRRDGVRSALRNETGFELVNVLPMLEARGLRLTSKRSSRPYSKWLDCK